MTRKTEHKPWMAYFVLLASLQRLAVGGRTKALIDDTTQLDQLEALFTGRGDRA